METKMTAKQLNEKLSAATQHAKDGSLEDAITILKEILTDQPDHEISLGMLASIYLQIGMHAKAIDKFKTLLHSNPENPLARFQLGMAHLSQGNPDEALDTWAPMLETEGEFMANFHSALALIQLNRRPEAMSLLDRARQNMPESHPLYPKLLDLQAQLNG